MAEQQSNQKNITLNLVQILDLGCGLLQQIFLKQAEDKAKAFFKELKSGKSIPIGEITLTNPSAEAPKLPSLPLSLQLDHSEFKGPGFSFPAYKTALSLMIGQIAKTVRAKKDLNILTNEETGTMLVHQPGVIQIGEQLNVMLLTIESAPKNGIRLKLIFVDPEQYKTKAA